MDTVKSLPSVIVKDKYDYLAKVIIIGASSTGKTSFVHRFVMEDFPRASQTIGVEFSSKLCVVDDVKIKLQLWDTAGQERFNSLTRSYYRSSAGVVMMFDLTDVVTLHRLDEFWLDVDGLIQSPTVVVVGNKCDLQHSIADEQVYKIIQTWGPDVKYIKASAKQGLNVREPFEALAHDIWQRIQSGAIDLEDQKYGVQYGDFDWGMSLKHGGPRVRTRNRFNFDEPQPNDSCLC